MKSIKKIIILSIFGLFVFAAKAQIITTIAGKGTFGFSGDGGQALNAEIVSKGIAVDAGGNIYLADAGNKRIRKIAPNGIITTIAGTGANGFGGDGNPSTTATIDNATNLDTDISGNIYIADGNNHRIRKIDASGIITTIAGNGSPGFSGDGGPATAAQLNLPIDVTADGAGNIYFIDQANSRIRKIAPNGIISTIAGDGSIGYGGDGGLATAAKLSSPTGLTLDATGKIYFTDQGNQRVRMINGSGIVNTVAGNGSPGFTGDGNLAVFAQLNAPIDVVVNGLGELFIVDQNNHRIRKVDITGVITTFAGIGSPGFSGDGGPANAAELSSPYGIAIDPTGNIYVSDAFNYRVRKITPAIVPVVKITAVPASPVCKGTPVVFTATVINAGVSPTYQWTKNSVNVGTNSSTYTDNSLTSADSIRCMITTSNAETAVSLPLQITVNNTPTPDISMFTTLCKGDSLVLTPGVYDSYLWQPGGSTNSSLAAKLPGIYSVTVTNNCGLGSAQTTITEIVCGVNLPNAFAPNGINKSFRLKNPPPLTRFRLAVYDRWGTNVFATEDVSKGWDGTYQGKLAPAGNYVWICEYMQPGLKKSFLQKGSLLLLR